MKKRVLISGALGHMGRTIAATMTEGLSGVHEFKELFFKGSAK